MRPRTRACIFWATALIFFAVTALHCGSLDETGLGGVNDQHHGRNVIVISFDALRPDALGAYGYTRPTSPNVDAFAERAIVFENAYATAPKTPTSFASFFTGRYPTQVFRDWRLESRETLASAFSSAGYHTAAFMNNPQLKGERGFSEGFSVYRDYPGLRDAPVMRDAIDWLDAQMEKEPGRPIFLWVHLIDPHSPWIWRRGSVDLYDASYSGEFEAGAAQLMRVEDEEELARVRSLYDGEILAVDRLFGQFVAALRKRGLYEDSLILLTSDHGEEFMEHGHVQHGWLNEENLRIPLMIRLPGQTQGRRVALQVSNLDLMPTLSGLVGIAMEGPFDGSDLTRSQSRHGAAIAGVANTVAHRASATLLEGSRRLVVHCREGDSDELFDLSLDPMARRNLAETSGEERLRLEGRMWSLLGIDGCDSLPIETIPPKSESQSGETRGLAPETVEALKRLGYLDGAGEATERRSPPEAESSK